MLRTCCVHTHAHTPLSPSFTGVLTLYPSSLQSPAPFQRVLLDYSLFPHTCLEREVVLQVWTSPLGPPVLTLSLARGLCVAAVTKLPS